jgi:predicted DNA-binding transcriptional regulator AlpA
MTKYLTTEEVATVCRTSTETVRYWRHVNKGPKSFKLGRRVLYAEDELLAWIEERKGSAAVPRVS